MQPVNILRIFAFSLALLLGRSNSNNAQNVSFVDAQSTLVYTRKNLTPCSKSGSKPSTSCVPTACPKFGTSC
jgi:hypothetical protein